MWLLLFNLLFALQPEKGRLIVGIGSYSYQTQTDELDLPILGGAGLLLSGGISPYWSMELNFKFLHKQYYDAESSSLEKRKRLDIGGGFRYWLIPELSVAAHITALYAAGDVQIQDSLSTIPLTEAQESVEYGLDFSLQFDLPLSEISALSFDYRYFKSITADSKESADVQGLLILYKLSLN